MRNLRNWTVLCLLLATTTAFASTSVPTKVGQRDGSDPPPMCVPGDPTCKP